MTARLFALAVLAAGAVAVSRAADPPVQPASERDAIYFGSSGPVRIRLHVTIDGQSVETAWGAAIDAVFAHADRNGDGALDAKERAAFANPPRPGRDMLLQFGGEQPLDTLRLAFSAKDEKVTRAQFAEAMKTAGRGPITLRTIAGRGDSNPLSTALFRRLDKNGDGKLSVEELKAARESLASLDIDEDEFLTSAELLNRAAVQNINRIAQFPGGMRQPQNTGDVTDLFFISPDGPPAVKQMLETRGGKKATVLKPAEFGGDAKAFAALDKDGNGTLDVTELTAWLNGTPDIEVPITFTKETGSLKQPAGVQPGVRFTFETPTGGVTHDWKRAADGVAAQFKKLGMDGVVERSAAEKQPLQLAVFDLADRNGDEKVDAAEVEATLKVLAPLANCRVDVAFADQGSGLFELLDRNGDGRLSPRELVDAVTVLAPLAGPDKLVGPNDLLRRFQVHTSVDAIPIGVVVTTRSAASAAKGGSTPPVWFTKMDRNADGDVSLREFVGPIDLFKKLDRDGDGLVSPAEALAAK